MMLLHTILIYLYFTETRTAEVKQKDNFGTSLLGPPTNIQLSEIAEIRKSMNFEDVSDVSKIQGTTQQLTDTAEIRKEIHQAIRNNEYARDAPHSKPHTTLKQLFPFLKFLLGNAKSDQTDTILSSTSDVANNQSSNIPYDNTLQIIAHEQKSDLSLNGTSKVKHGISNSNNSEILRDFDEKSKTVLAELKTSIDKVKEKMLSSESDNSTFPIKSNIVESNIAPESNEFKIKQEAKSKFPQNHYKYREVLDLVSITEDLNFALGENILAWKTLQVKSYGKYALVGMSLTTIILVHEKQGKYEIIQELTFESKITSFNVFNHWNSEYKLMECVIIVAIENQLFFILVRDNMSKMEIVWKWSTHATSIRIEYFKINNIDSILLINEINQNNKLSSANVYQFNIDTKKSWLFQMIALADPCISADVLDTGRDLIICLAQENAVNLYRYDNQIDSAEKFTKLMKIHSDTVKTVSAFQMGGYSYVAIGGLKPQILRYYRGQFYPQTILSQSWGHVEKFVPISARTCRDDLILLVQHRINFQTHSISVVEALIWDGESFDLDLSIPCHIGDDNKNFGFTCILDYKREEGISGAAIIQVGNTISLLVPRFQAPSGLFQMKIVLKPVANPVNVGMVKKQGKYEQLKKMIEYQDVIIAQAGDSLLNSIRLNDSLINIDETWNIRNLDVNVAKVINVEIEEIYFGVHKWTDEDTEVNIPALIDILLDTVAQLEQLENELGTAYVNDISDDSIKIVENSPTNGKFDIDKIRILNEKNVRNKRNSNNPKNVNMRSMKVENLNVEFINDIPVEQLIFIENNELQINGTLLIQDDLTVNDKLVLSDLKHNDLKASNYKARTADRTIQNLHIPGDINVETINGVNWQKLIGQIVMTNLPNHLNNLYLSGDLIVQNNISISTLNNETYPDNFLWSYDDEDNIVKGSKNFTGNLTTTAIDCEIINGVNTFEIITLSDPQYIPGLTTFKQLEVTESLDVNGTVSGKHLDDFLANPSMLQTKIIQSDCLFHNLQVDGPIYINNDCNGIHIDSVLSDVVYKSNPKTVCTSFKTFHSIDANLQLTSNLINGEEIEKFVTTDSFQEITFDRIIGNAVVGSLYLDGLFDFINITELDQNSIKITGEQYTEADLVFENINSHNNLDVDSNNIEVLMTLNGFKLEDFVKTSDSFELDRDVYLNGVYVDDLYVNGEIKGKPIVNSVDLHKLEESRLSASTNQEISAPYFIKTAIVDGNIDSDMVNGYEINQLQNDLNKIKNIYDILQSGSISIGNLIIDGSIEITNINKHDFNAIKDNAIWLNRQNTIRGNIKFLDEIIVEENLMVDRLNDELFTDFVNGLILKSNNIVNFEGSKVFVKGLHVSKVIDAAQINTISTSNILTKVSFNDMTGDVDIFGNIYVKDIQVQGVINNVQFQKITDLYEFDVNKQAHVIKRNIDFKDHIAVGSLQLNYGVNSVTNVTDFLYNIIRKDHYGNIAGCKTFRSKVHFNNGLYIEKYDDINLNTFLQEIVLTDRNEPFHINGNVAFTNPVTATNIKINGDVIATYLMDCSIAEWYKNSLRIDLPQSITTSLTFSPGSFRATTVVTVYLNGYIIADVITLHTPQKLSGATYITNIYSMMEIAVGSKVNNVNLRKERENTIMIYGNQYITAPTTIQAARVLQSLQTTDTVDGIDIKYPAITNGDIYLQSPISFGRISVKNINTKDLISGIDFNYWFENALRKSSIEPQIITGNWSIENNLTVTNIDGNGYINNIDFHSISDRLNSHKSNIAEHLEALHKDYRGICNNVAKLIKKTQKDIYFLSFFELAFKISEHNPIHSIYLFQAKSNNFLLVNVGCITHLYIWNKVQYLYEKICEVETGVADSWLNLFDHDYHLHLVSNSVKNAIKCNETGLNIWRFDGSTLVHVTNLANSDEYTSIRINTDFLGRFYALNKNTHSVVEFNLAKNVLEEWKLPSDGDQHRFVPRDSNLGLALSDGKHLIVLSSLEISQVRKERNLNWMDGNTVPDYVDVDEKDMSKRFFSEAVREKIKASKESYKLSQQERLKAMSMAGPFKNVSFSKNTMNNGLFSGIFDSKFGNKNKQISSKANSQQPEVFIKSNNSNINNIDALESSTKSPIPVADPTFNLTNAIQSNSSNKAIVSKNHDNTKYDLNQEIHNFDVTTPGYKNSILILNDTLFNSSKQIADVEKLISIAVHENNVHNEFDGVGKNHTKTPIVGDIFGEIESIAKPIADEIVDTLAEVDDNSNGGLSDLTDIVEDVVRPIYDDLRDTILNIEDALENEDISSTFDQTKSKTQNYSAIAETTPKSMRNTTNNDTNTKILHELNKTSQLGDKEKPKIVDVSSINNSNRDKNNSINASPAVSDWLGDLKDLMKPVADKMADTITNVDENHHNTDVDIGKSRNASNTGPFDPMKLNDTNVPVVGGIVDSLKETLENVITTYHDGKEFIEELRADITFPSKIHDELQDEKYEKLHGSYKENDNITHHHSNYDPDHVSNSQNITEVNNSSFTANPETSINDLHDKAYLPNIPRVVFDQNAPINGNGTTALKLNTTTIAPSLIEPNNKQFTQLNNSFLVTNDFTTESNFLEQIISKEIPNGGLLAAENKYLPAFGAQEIVTLKVSNNKMFVAVTSLKDVVVQGKHDRILIYEDILEGKLFQTLECHKPRSLSTLYLRDETILAFIEGKADIKIYNYRGVQGFALFASFTPPSHVLSLTSVTLPPLQPLACPTKFLVAIVINEIWFLEAKTNGNCGIDVNVKCDLN